MNKTKQNIREHHTRLSTSLVMMLFLLMPAFMAACTGQGLLPFVEVQNQIPQDNKIDIVMENVCTQAPDLLEAPHFLLVIADNSASLEEDPGNDPTDFNTGFNFRKTATKNLLNQVAIDNPDPYATFHLTQFSNVIEHCPMPSATLGLDSFVNVMDDFAQADACAEMQQWGHNFTNMFDAFKESLTLLENVLAELPKNIASRATVDVWIETDGVPFNGWGNNGAIPWPCPGADPWDPDEDPVALNEFVTNMKNLEGETGFWKVTVNSIFMGNSYAPGSCERNVAEQIVADFAALGGGTFTNIIDAADLDLTTTLTAPLKGQWEMESLFVWNRNAVHGDVVEPDTDGDGLTDAFEASIGLNVLNPDTDNDCYNDLLEFEASGFDPLIPSTGCQDGFPDSDGDGLNDLEESAVNSDPELEDTDRDGIDDFMEWRNGTSPTLADAHLDYDNDGVPNKEEIQRRTDPLSIDSAEVLEHAYEVTITDAYTTTNGRQCVDLVINNVTLVESLDLAPNPAGYNSMQIIFDQKPSFIDNTLDPGNFIRSEAGAVRLYGETQVPSKGVLEIDGIENY